MSLRIIVSSSKCGTQNLGSTLNQGSLIHTTVLLVYKEMLDDLDFNGVANKFAQESKCKLSVFGNSE